MEIYMKTFIDKNFLLNNGISKKLYNIYAKDMPIIDYHCHIDAEEIAKDKKFDNITQLWLGGDHYKWRLMRANGIDEKYITGDATDYDKFSAWAKTLERIIGNPLYHWSHMELKTYFGYDGILNSSTADNVWTLCNEKLKTISAKQIIEQSGVEVICTTDDPLSSLQWHKTIAESSFCVKVLPAWRPDKILDIENTDFCQYIKKMSDITGIEIKDFNTLKKSILNRLEYFDLMGCKISDHSFSKIIFEDFKECEIDGILQTALNNKTLTDKEIYKFKTACILFMAEEYAKKEWVMQLHYGVCRNVNAKMLSLLGVDSGFDTIGDSSPITNLGMLLNKLSLKNLLPKTVIYSLNPNDNQSIDGLCGCFQEGETAGKIQHGSAWWFNDNKKGITDHLTSLANLGILSNFIGMLTDSRSFLSYTRHDYFRRILCDFIGDMVERGEYPKNYESLGKIVQDICYYNAKKYFNL